LGTPQQAHLTARLSTVVTALGVADAQLQRHRTLAGALVAATLVLFWISLITPAAVDNDAAENLQLALNLAHHGAMSVEAEAPFLPSMAREPLPVTVDAGLIRLLDAASERAPPDQYFIGWRAQLLKLQNVFWLAILCATVFTAVRQFTGSPATALVAVAVINLPLLGPVNGRYLANSLYTEAPASALLALASLLLVVSLRRRSALGIAATGLVFGMLVLVKAVFLFVFVGLVACLAVALAWHAIRDRTQLARAVLQVALLVGACAVVLAPWVSRNYAEFESVTITERSGEVLHVRALKDRMTAEEIRGALYVWAPWPVSAVLRRVFGFSRADLERGGRLQRLYRWEGSSFADEDLAAQHAGRPEDAISYFRKSRAEFRAIVNELTAAGHPHPLVEGNKILREHALQMIREHPFRHLALTPLFLWRGAFFVFPLLSGALLFALWRRDGWLALLLLPAFGMVMFYGLFSHFLARYSLPAYPLTAVGVAIVTQRWLVARAAAAASASRVGSLEARAARPQAAGLARPKTTTL
jgi:hypothetical protein